MCRSGVGVRVGLGLMGRRIGSSGGNLQIDMQPEGCLLSPEDQDSLGNFKFRVLCQC